MDSSQSSFQYDTAQLVQETPFRQQTSESSSQQLSDQQHRVEDKEETQEPSLQELKTNSEDKDQKQSFNFRAFQDQDISQLSNAEIKLTLQTLIIAVFQLIQDLRERQFEFIFLGIFFLENSVARITQVSLKRDEREALLIFEQLKQVRELTKRLLQGAQTQSNYVKRLTVIIQNQDYRKKTIKQKIVLKIKKSFSLVLTLLRLSLALRAVFGLFYYPFLRSNVWSEFPSRVVQNNQNRVMLLALVLIYLTKKLKEFLDDQIQISSYYSLVKDIFLHQDFQVFLITIVTLPRANCLQSFLLTLLLLLQTYSLAALRLVVPAFTSHFRRVYKTQFQKLQERKKYTQMLSKIKLMGLFVEFALLAYADITRLNAAYVCLLPFLTACMRHWLNLKRSSMQEGLHSSSCNKQVLVFQLISTGLLYLYICYRIGQINYSSIQNLLLLLLSLAILLVDLLKVFYSLRKLALFQSLSYALAHDQAICVICRENLLMTLTLPCRHRFHRRCIYQGGKLELRCPVCRLEVGRWLTTFQF